MNHRSILGAVAVFLVVGACWWGAQSTARAETARTSICTSDPGQGLLGTPKRAASWQLWFDARLAEGRTQFVTLGEGSGGVVAIVCAY